MLTVTVSPEKSGTITVDNYGSTTTTATYTLPDNEMVTMRAAAAEGYAFLNWSLGASTFTENPTTKWIDCDRSYIANFQSNAGPIMGLVWDDLNGNGIKDEGEPGLSGIDVTLRKSADESLVESTLSGVSGEYDFGDTPAGSYLVEFGLKSGYLFTAKGQGGEGEIDSDVNPESGRTDAFNHLAASTSERNCGMVPFSGNVTPEQARAMTESSRDLVVIDVRDEASFCDGHILCAANYPWASGFLNDHVGELDPDAPTLLVSQDGAESTLAANFLDSQGFTNVYNMSAGMDAWTGPTILCGVLYPLADAGDDFSVNEKAVAFLSGGGSSTENIYDYTWEQLSGPVVALSDSHSLTPSFAAPVVDEDTPLEFRLTAVAVCRAEHEDTVTVTVKNTGFNAVITGLVWDDLNENGLMDPGEPGLPGIAVTIYDDSCDCPVANTATIEGGLYQTVVDAAGDYYAKFGLPVGSLFTIKDAGGDDSLDSDADPATGKTDPVAVTTDGQVVTWDAGIYEFYGNVNVAEGLALFNADRSLVVLDVREEAEYCGATGHIPCSLLYPYSSGYLAANLAQLEAAVGLDARLLVTCAVGGRSTQAAKRLQDYGFTDISNMLGGMNEWSAVGYPTVACGEDFPQAHAGDALSVDEGDYVQLSGITSTSEAFAAYSWTQLSGPAVAIANSHTLTPSFYAPLVNLDTELSFELSVTAKCGDSATDTVSVTVRDQGFSTAAFGRVWDDQNENGLMDPGEPGLSGVTVTLYDASCDCQEGATATNPDGDWEIAVPAPGDYYVKFGLYATGWLYSPEGGDSDANPLSGATATATLSLDGSRKEWNAGEYAFPGNMSVAEGLALYQSDRDLVVLDVREESEFCAVGGHIPCSLNYPYSSGWLAGHLADLAAETGLNAKILVTCAVGGRSTKAAQMLVEYGFTDISNMLGGMNEWIADAYPTVPCGLAYPIAAAGTDAFVEEDSLVGLSGEGSSTEAIFSYTWTQLSGPDVALQGADTLYPSFTAPSVDADTELTFQLTVEAQCRAVDSDTVTVTVQNSACSAAVNGLVWNDLNENGLMDPGEPGIPGITVTLYDASCDCIEDVTTTLDGGLYQFAVTRVGEYYAKYGLPLGYLFTAKDAGANDEADSDVDPATGKTDTVAISADGQVVTWDAGMYAFHGNVSCAEGLALFSSDPGLVVVDVREESEYCGATGHIPCSLLYPYSSGYLAANLADLAADVGLNARLLVTCAVGGRSTQAAKILQDYGFTDISNMLGGMNEWSALGYPALDCLEPFPAAHAGDDQTVDEGDEVYLSGITSSAEAFAAYSWTQLSGPAVAIANPHTLTPSFYAPLVNLDTDFSFQLEVTAKCGDAATDTVSVTVRDQGFNTAAFGHVWDDQNENGILDAGEPGLSGVTVTLYDASCDCQEGATATNPDGDWEIAVPAPGDYYVKFGLYATGWLYSPEGGDSDADPATGRTETAEILLDGSLQEWNAGEYAFAGNLSVAEGLALYQADRDLVVVDVREDSEYCAAGGHIPCSLLYPYSSGYLADHLADLAADVGLNARLLVTCAVGGRSTKAVEMLENYGFTDIGNMLGGMNEWIADGYPTVTCDSAYPEAEALADSPVTEGGTGTLYGGGSSVTAVLSTTWSQVSGTAVVLSDAGALTPTFVAPSLAAAQDLVFSLRVVPLNGRCGEVTSQATVRVNDNGIDPADFPDAQVTFKSHIGQDMGIAGASGDLVALSVTDPAGIADNKGRPDNLPYGLVNFSMKVAAGGTARVVIYFPEALAAGSAWYKHTADGWINLSALDLQAQKASAVIAPDRKSVTVSIVDNGPYDLNPAPGLVSDPSGPGFANAPAPTPEPEPSKSSDGGGGGCFVGSLSQGLPGIAQIFALLGLAAAGLVALRKRNAG